MNTQPKYTKAFDVILNDRWRWLQHILFWLYFYIDIPVSFLFDPTEIAGTDMNQILLLASDMFLVYLNLYVLIPLFLLKNKARLYLLFTFLTVLAVNSLIQYTHYDYNLFETDDGELVYVASGAINSFITQTSILGTAIGINILKRFLRSRSKIEQLESSNLKTELAYLKEQINPHFLFNALNNIYVQTRKRPQEASESILLLSDLLRYQLYDCAKEKVYLKGELDYLKNYLKLDSFRKNNAHISFDIKGSPNGKTVAPFIFLPFIENAVKHGLSIDNESFIKINFDISDTEIKMTVENSKPNVLTANRVGGIGLTNVNRRLNLLYPDSHELKVEDSKTTYKVELKLF